MDRREAGSEKTVESEKKAREEEKEKKKEKKKEEEHKPENERELIISLVRFDRMHEPKCVGDVYSNWPSKK
jgi:hypothetical protein